MSVRVRYTVSSGATAQGKTTVMRMLSGLSSPTEGSFLLKILLFQSLSTVLLFLAAGIGQKTLASITGVVFGSGMLGLAYLGLENAAENVFGIEEVNISDYAPDQLIASTGNIAALSSLIISVAVTAVFLSFTVRVFNVKDIK